MQLDLLNTSHLSTNWTYGVRFSLRAVVHLCPPSELHLDKKVGGAVFKFVTVARGAMFQDGESVRIVIFDGYIFFIFVTV